MAPVTTSMDRSNSPASTSTTSSNQRSDQGDRDSRVIARNQELSPTQTSWQIIAAGAVIPLGLAAAAAVATYFAVEARVAVAAWVAVAVVGTASVISTAAASRYRTRSTERMP